MLVCRIKPPARCPENLLRGTMFRLVEIVLTGPLFVLAGYAVPGGSGLSSLSCCEINFCRALD